MEEQDILPNFIELIHKIHNACGTGIAGESCLFCQTDLVNYFGGMVFIG